MKITFLTSSLAPGKDGVGDYTRLLAEGCLRQGHACSVIALNDRHLKEPVKSDVLTSAGNIPMLRLPAAMPWPVRAEKASAFRDRFQPDWISLQFVPYGFHDKGIVWNIIPHLRIITAGHPLQIMFHEVWIAPHVGASVKERMVGALQRHCLRQMVRVLQPQVFHTNTPAAKELLRRNGINADILPLFGHIPFPADKNSSWLLKELQSLGLDISPDQRNDFWLFGIFGSLHPIWPPEPLFSYLRDAARKHRRKIAILAIGHMGSGASLWDSLAAQYSAELTFHKLGERTPEEISEFLQSVDFGIATSPWAIIGKSGTVASMLEHGLPVIVNRDDVKFPFEIADPLQQPLLIKMKPELPNTLASLQRMPPRSFLPVIAAQFIESLSR